MTSTVLNWSQINCWRSFAYRKTPMQKEQLVIANFEDQQKFIAVSVSTALG